MQVGIIGYGRFGKLAAGYLAKHVGVVVADRTVPRQLQAGVAAAPMEEAASKPVVVLAVPINALPGLLKQVAPFLRPDAILLDVCSVKEKPLQWMMRAAPKTVTVIGTHPLFGPDSAAESLEGRNIVLCPGRTSKPILEELRRSLSSAGLNPFVMTAEEHDRLMASTLFLTQFIGHGVSGKLLPNTTITTQNFEKLKQVVLTSQNDTTELFRDMYKFNRFARKIPNTVIKGMEKVLKKLK